MGVAFYDSESACWEAPSVDSRFGDDLRARCLPTDLVLAADKAMYAAKHAGRACGRLLDIADVGDPQRAREVAPLKRRS